MDCRKLGLLNGPHKYVIQVKNEVGKVKTMLIDPSVFDKLMAKRINASTSKTNDAIPPPSIEMEIDGEGEAEVDDTGRVTTMAKNDLKPSAEMPKEIFEDEEPSIPNPGPESAEEKESKMEVDGQSDEVKKEEEGGKAGAKPEKKMAAELPPKNEECRKFKTDLINVSLGIDSANRILYPKIAHKIPSLDGLLARRLRLYNLEEKELVTTYGTETLEKVKSNVDPIATEQPISIKIDDHFHLGGIYIDYKCYSHFCNVDAKSEKKDYESLCYSPLCRFKFVTARNHMRKLERIKNAERNKYEKAKKEILAKRHYTQPESSGKIYLKKPPPAFLFKKRNPVKYQPHFEVRKLARSSGRNFTSDGYTQNPQTSWRDNHARPVNTPNIEAPSPTVSQQIERGIPANPHSYFNVLIVGGKKFIITKSGRNVITTPVTTSSPASTEPGLTSSTNPDILNLKISPEVISKPTTSNPPQQEQSAGLSPIHLYKTADGKLQISRLAPGQQAYQTSDGRIHVVTLNNNMGEEQSPLNVISSISKPQQTAIASTPPPPPQLQRIQVVKMSDGKVQIRGLLPGQQAIIEDRKIHITRPPPQTKQPQSSNDL